MLSDETRGGAEGEKKVGKVNKKDEERHQRLQVLYDELEEECLTAVKYIEALKMKELSASITHLRIQTEALEQGLEEAMAA